MNSSSNESLFCILFHQFFPVIGRGGRLEGGKWKHYIAEYVHAADGAQARFKFQCTVTNPAYIDIIGIAPVVLYKVEDKEGKILSV